MIITLYGYPTFFEDIFSFVVSFNRSLMKRIINRIDQYFESSPHRYLAVFGLFLFILILDRLVFSGRGAFLSFEFYLLAIWLFSVFLFKMEGRSSVIIGLILLGLVPLFVILGNENIADRSAGLAFIFLLVGVLRSIYLVSVQKESTVQ